jgi:hypothetical protein
MLDKLNLGSFFGFIAANPIAVMQMLAPQLVEMGTYYIIEIPDAFLIVVAIHVSAIPS